MSQADGSGFDLVKELGECQEINTRVSDRLDHLVEGIQAGTAGVAIWSLDTLETDCRELASHFKKIAAVLRVL